MLRQVRGLAPIHQDGAMNLNRELRYSGSLEDVRAMLLDPAYWDRVADATGAASSATTVEDQGGAVVVITDEQQKVAGVPSFAKKFVGETTHAIKTAAWKGDTADFTVDTPGKPTSMSGTASLSSAGDTTTLQDLKDKLASINTELEKAIPHALDLAKALGDEKMVAQLQKVQLNTAKAGNQISFLGLSFDQTMPDAASGITSGRSMPRTMSRILTS